MQIAVYPGSFDPLHIGHLAVMEHLLSSGEFDRVYLVISPQNPFKDPSKADNARQRYLAAAEAAERHPELDIKVDDIELSMPAPHYTIRTLDALRAREPENSFTLVIGADNLQNLRRWKDADRLLSEYRIAAYPRRGYDLQAARQELMRECGGACDIRLIDAPMVDISSTLIRERQALGTDMSEYLM